MDKNVEAVKNKGIRDGGSAKSDTSKKRLQEPPKFYNKNYLKRYNQVEMKASTPLPILSSPMLMKKSPAVVSKSQKETQMSSGLITMSPTTLKLADGSESIASDRESMKPIAEINNNSIKNEASINPYNRTIPMRDQHRYKTQIEQDYRYSLVNAMSSVKSSYFKGGIDNMCSDHGPDHRSGSDDDHLLSELAKNDTYKKIKNKVEDAIKRHKIFQIRGELPKLKEALEERGWIQKYESNRTRSLPYGASNLEAKSLGDLRLADGSLNERALVFALLRHVHPDFIWDCRNDFSEWDRSIAGSVLLNRLQKPGLYTSKLGMAHVLQEAHWLYETNVSDVLFPRSYNPSRDQTVLIQDFRRSASVAVLKRFLDRIGNLDMVKLESQSTNDETQQQQQQSTLKKIEETDSSGFLDKIEFALKCCEEHVVELEHSDIDVEGEPDAKDDEWRAFFEDCEKLLYKTDGMDHLPVNCLERLQAISKRAQSTIKRLKSLDPQFMLNGDRNIWIVKPSNLCCGSGIFMTHDLKTILRKAESKPRDYYVVQKYIERPFLVFATKFDIRQWFLVTCSLPMTIWSFKEALLRMSSKPYTSTTYHEAIHLCNTAVQEKYDSERRRRLRNRVTGHSGEEAIETSIRDQGWDCDKLNEYLKNVGFDGEPYYEMIYPKMTQAIVLTMLAAQESMDRRRCSFELYGADFMVMADLSVWLIEINTNPRMHPPSSRITQRLYGAVQESLIKVIMDLPVNPNADTGGFELVYKQSVPESQPYLGPCLFAFGKSMTLHEAPLKKRPGGAAGERAASPYSPWDKQYRAWTAPPMIDRLRETKIADFSTHLNNIPAPMLCLEEESEDMD